VIRSLSGPGVNVKDITTEFSQALLQHYGWRSFYVDLTSHFPVAAWFASHTFNAESVLVYSEDCLHDTMLLGHRKAYYSSADREGHIYVLRESALTERQIGIFDLEITRPGDFSARYSRQHAFLIGPLTDGYVPPDLVYAHLVCPSSVLAQAAALSGFDKTEDLFPSREEDAILRAFLSIPWNRVEDGCSPPAFIRGLILPEYDFRHVGQYPAQNAFYTPFWIADDRVVDRPPFRSTTFLRVPEEVFYILPLPVDQKLEKISAFMRVKSSVAIETTGIVSFPEFPSASFYGKGVFLNLIDQETVEISSIIIEHPGMQITGVAVNEPWTYRINGDATWTRVSGPQDCPCNNDQRHLHNCWVVGALEHLFSEGEFVERNIFDFEWQSRPERKQDNGR
jgi:hypothetical protein